MSEAPFFILLPPSEGKATEGTLGSSWDCESGAFGALLGSHRSEIARTLKKLKGGDGPLLGVKGGHLARAQEANRTLVGSATLPAWRRYTGVVWDHLDLESFPAAQRNALLKRILIPSGMAGLVRADDPLPDYRLKMGARLSTMGLMSTWWRTDITTALTNVVKKRAVIDLLPQEHRAAFSWPDVPTAVRVDLVSKSGGVVGGHNAKAAKGLLAQHLLTASGSDISKILSGFKHAEYSARIAS
jgi:cytoplasmic iron level regulating protein YaaA (DUF328/UPF0246 family)